MSERLLKLGVTPEYFAHAKHFERVFRNRGYTPAQVDALIQWGAEFNGKPEDRIPQFNRLCEEQGIDLVNSDLAVSWHQQVEEKGIDAMPQQPPAPVSRDADAKRLQEIQEDMRKPRGDSKYWKSPEMRDEYRELLERVEGGDDATGEQSAVGEYVPLPSNDSARRLEIEQLMKTDRAAYHRTGADKEYLQILQRESGEPDAQPEAATEGSNDDAHTP